jgi:hypothetical protein
MTADRLVLPDESLRLQREGEGDDCACDHNLGHAEETDIPKDPRLLPSVVRGLTDEALERRADCVATK